MARPPCPTLRLLEDPPRGVANISSEQFPDYRVTYGGAKRRSYPEIGAILAGLYAEGGFAGGMRPPGTQTAWSA
jgi:hypothetical protein